MLLLTTCVRTHSAWVVFLCTCSVTHDNDSTTTMQLHIIRLPSFYYNGHASHVMTEASWRNFWLAFSSFKSLSILMATFISLYSPSHTSVHGVCVCVHCSGEEDGLSLTSKFSLSYLALLGQMSSRNGPATVFEILNVNYVFNVFSFVHWIFQSRT